MEHYVYKGEAPSHGFKVGVATHFISWVYEQLLREPLDQLDVAAACARWRPESEVDAEARQIFKSEEIQELARRERAAKHVTREELADQLNLLRTVWPELRGRLQRQLLPSAEIRRRLAAVGAPDRPEAIGITRERMADCAWRAQQIRRRFTVLDFALRTGLLQDILARYREHGDE
jgi:glycerol-1-phosphate dehydrogenase [NAD(P)+]